ncbi:MAG: oxygen-dependent coproporphyrinogen oxidase [Flavobacteriaceae bacterium]|nr:oxygen-dependent coproporphyrinogen oxidase [Flavobacteriaceae bacterium]
MDLNKKKDIAVEWFRSLRDQFCDAFIGIDESGNFERKSWPHKGKGGGEMSIMKGEVFEKVGVNISTVSGEFSDDYRSQVKGTEDSANYWASGISLVAHMQSPLVPAFHFNTRFLVTKDFWFGGGADMTPTFVDKQDTNLFHKKLEEACDVNDSNYYQEFKKNCDEYFYLPHREETRGEGGIFFDHHNTGDWEKDFKFIQDVGLKTKEAMISIINSHKDREWTEEEKNEQLYKRGRYVEFNLLWDRGTLFGIKTGGSTEAILMSMPPEAKWK